MKEFIKNTIITIIFILLTISVIQGAFILVGPDYKKGKYTMVYKVHFPNNTCTYTITNEYPISVRSSRGTNYISKSEKTPYFKNMFNSVSVFETNAPIEVISYTYSKK